MKKIEPQSHLEDLAVKPQADVKPLLVDAMLGNQDLKPKKRVRHESPQARIHRLEHLRQWRQQHPDYIKTKNRLYRLANHERIDERIRQYRLLHPKNPESVRQYSKAWYQRNKKRRSEQIKAYKRANREQYKLRQAAYDKAHAAQKRLQTRAWLKAHPDYTRARQVRQKAQRKGALVESSAIADRIVRKWKAKKRFVCYYCQKRFPISKMHVDHIIALVNGGKHSPENICSACDTCNTRKREKALTDLVFLTQPVLAL